MRVLLIVLFFMVYVIHAQKDTIIYYPNGNMMHKSQILNGVLQGPYVGYYENGNLKAKGTLKNDKASVQLEKVTLTESEASSENRGSIIAEKIAQLSFYIDKTGRRGY